MERVLHGQVARARLASQVGAISAGVRCILAPAASAVLLFVVCALNAGVAAGEPFMEGMFWGVVIVVLVLSWLGERWVEFLASDAAVAVVVAMIVASPLLLTVPGARGHGAGGLRVARRVCIVLIGLTVLLPSIGWPKRVAFAWCRAEFESRARAAERGRPAGSGLVGLYQVERTAVDPRGGVYFVVPELVSWGPDSGARRGLVWKPNAEGTPFGDEGLTLEPLGGDWSWFQAYRR